jgi:hypothetical protein
VPVASYSRKVDFNSRACVKICLCRKRECCYIVYTVYFLSLISNVGLFWLLQEGLKVDKATLLKDAYEKLQAKKDDYYKGEC